MKKTMIFLAAAGVATLALAQGAAPGVFTADGKLRRPADVREYVYLSSGIGMAYGPSRTPAGAEPPFTNVFVNPESYRAFMQTGQWPERSVFFLEVRQAVANASVNTGGRTQSAPLALEAAVKDKSRFPEDGWGYFDLGHDAASAAPQPRSASCYACHRKHAAVDWTFSQFYPEQFAVAQRKGTVRKDYDPNLKAQ